MVLELISMTAGLARLPPLTESMAEDLELDGLVAREAAGWRLTEAGRLSLSTAA